MLIKNEAEHLRRTLPRWAKVIDYWIIGVDDANTDESPEVIQQYLGHIPGEIVIVHFDGMGPTWSQLVQVGIDKYPGATHGIIADADFMPMKDHLDKMQLDIRCSKHMYTIWTEDHRNERKMDWIYRNIQGAVVKRRTHQILEVPELEDQEVFQTLIDLPVEEREGGWGDRSGKKNERYIGWLEKDLEEYPNDTRTLYYLGYAHFDIYNQNKDSAKPEHWEHLRKGVEYFKWRMQVPGGNAEELWFATLKLGEIYERFYQDWAEAEKFYLNCTATDPERADAWFYIGQHYRLRNQIDKSLPYLLKAAKLPMPERSLFQWHYLYECLSKLEYGRALVAKSDATKQQFKEGKRLLTLANCANGDPGNLAEQKSLKDLVSVKLSKSKTDSKVSSLRKLLTLVDDHIDQLEDDLSARFKQTASLPFEFEDELRVTYWDVLNAYLDPFQDWVEQHKKLKGNKTKLETFSTCKRYRKLVSPYIKFLKEYESDISNQLSSRRVQKEWERINALIRTTCR